MRNCQCTLLYSEEKFPQTPQLCTLKIKEPLCLGHKFISFVSGAADSSIDDSSLFCNK